MTPPAKTPPRRRHCTYCPQPGADCCIRVQLDTGNHVYAHKICAAVRGVARLYVFLDDGITMVQRSQ